MHAIVITAVIVAVFDVWFSRRMGLVIDRRGITLHYAFHRKRVPWAVVRGFEWKRWNSPRTESLWITPTAGGSAIRVPTVAAPRREGRNDRLLTGSYQRISSDGVQVDAMDALQNARICASSR